MDTVHSIQTWEDITGELKELAALSKEKRDNKSNLESELIRAMVVEHGLTYVDASGCGEGPYYIIKAEHVSMAWNKERFINFFKEVEQEVTNGGNRPTPEELANAAALFAKRNGKSHLKLVKNKSLTGVSNISQLKEIYAQNHSSS